MRKKKFKTIKFRVPVEYADVLEKSINNLIDGYINMEFKEFFQHVTIAEGLGIKIEVGIPWSYINSAEVEKRFNEIVEKNKPETLGDRMVRVMDDYNRAELKALQGEGINAPHLRWFKDLVDTEVEGKPVERFWPCGCDRVSINPDCKYGDSAEHDVFFLKLSEAQEAIYEVALHVFDTREDFDKWLDTPNFTFDNNKPRIDMETFHGLRFISTIITGMKYGDNV
jgi:hypothetical protein